MIRSGYNGNTEKGIQIPDNTICHSCGKPVGKTYYLIDKKNEVTGKLYSVPICAECCKPKE